MRKAWTALPALLATGSAATAHAQPPLSYLQTFGPAGDAATALNWAAIAISIVVSLIIGLLVLAGVWRRRAPQGAADIRATPVERRGDGVRWIWIGVALTSVVLLAVLIWTVAVLVAVANPPRPPQLTIAVTGHQWWWEAVYKSPDPAQRFVTANELHIPVGQPVRIELLSADVIHSFWVPALAGKTDTIPGRRNIAWLQADKPGRYMGQCTEYCGQQHAHMSFTVVAEPPAQFEAWRRRQLAPPPAPATAEQQRGLQLVVAKCGACHAIRGTDAGGRAGPDLTHLMSRSTLAAGAVPNTVAGLSGWIANPQALKPGTRMPTLYLSGPELNAIRSYLLSLD